jgi:YHS domain-containing protein
MNRWNTNNDNVCINGWDPVCFWEGAPQQGDPGYTWTYEGCTFWFYNEQNKSTFESNPTKYAPQFGGFCAYGIYEGECRDIDPSCWIISGDKLYFFANDDVKSSWQKDEVACCTTAGKNWSQGVRAAA